MADFPWGWTAKMVRVGWRYVGGCARHVHLPDPWLLR